MRDIAAFIPLEILIFVLKGNIADRTTNKLWIHLLFKTTKPHVTRLYFLGMFPEKKASVIIPVLFILIYLFTKRKKNLFLDDNRLSRCFYSGKMAKTELVSFLGGGATSL